MDVLSKTEGSRREGGCWHALEDPATGRHRSVSVSQGQCHVWCALEFTRNPEPSNHSHQSQDSLNQHQGKFQRAFSGSIFSMWSPSLLFHHCLHSHKGISCFIYPSSNINYTYSVCVYMHMDTSVPVHV